MLYLVSTPIGNLGDMSLRGIEVLKAVDLIASEDTRKTGILLKHFEISQPQIAFNEFNEKKVVARLINMLLEGKNLALVTDAGTPSISDPGYLLVRATIEAGIEITAVPGPSAVIAALTLSGLPLHSFLFKGFAPNKAGPRKAFLAAETETPHTLVFYESPYRLLAFLDDALEVYGDREGAIANDLTKKFEMVLRGKLSEIKAKLEAAKIQGEYVVCIAGAEKPKKRRGSDQKDPNRYPPLPPA